MNLSSRRDSEPAGLQSNIANCLEVVRYLPPNLERIIDLGSGQGFPAIPIAIMTGISIEMVEADRRKAAFLTTALATLNVSGRVVCERIENARLEPAECVTARALAPLVKLLPMALPFISSPGCALFLKGPAAQAEIAALGPAPQAVIELLPTASDRSCLVRVRRLG